jgi:hypothetical protein
MIGMQDRLQRFHIHVNQEIGLNWKAFQLAIVPEIDCDKSFWFFVTPFPLGGTKNKLQRRRRDLKKLYVVGCWPTNRKDAWEKDQRYHRLSSESGIPKKALIKVKKEDRLKSSSNRGF